MVNTLKLPVGIDSFEKIRKNRFYYIDKTKLIEQLVETGGEVTLFTRPRRFGKTLNMSMLRSFFEIDADESLFDGLYITKNKELCEQYYQEYKRILSNKKTILSTHLKSTETDDIRVYIDILTSLEIHIHDILSNSNSKGYNNEYVTNLLARLNGYAHILKAIEEESFLRMAALSSLKSIPFLSNNKKNAIDNEISRLQIQIFNAQKDIELINLQINSCLSIIENLNFNNKDKELLSSFFKDLGTTDIDGELSHIKMYQELFSEQYKLSKEDIKNKGKLYRMLGLFSGLAFVVLFI